MEFVTLAKIKMRVDRIIDKAFQEFPSTCLYGLDQTKIEEIHFLLNQAIVPKSANINPIAVSMGTKKMKNLKLPRPILSEQSQLVEIGQNQIRVYQSMEKECTAFSYAENWIRKFSSVIQVTQNKFIISGGCSCQNPNTKSGEILLLDSGVGNLKKVGTMISSVSSHSSIFIQSRVYFIGGKKDEGAITRTCSCFDITTNKSSKIASLNYGVASACVINWKNVFIYKAGGLGECFGEWNISPYIQRYSIVEDIWEIINPDVGEEGLPSMFQFHAYSLGYVSVKDELVILGGFNSMKKSTNFGCVIAVKANDVHEIADWGFVSGLEEGGFYTAQLLLSQKRVLALQTQTKSTLFTKLIELPCF